MRFRILATTILLSTLLSGCWDREELKDLALVMATGVDKTDRGQIRVTVQIAVPSSVGGGQMGQGGDKKKSFIVESAEGKDITDADQKLQEKVPRLLYTAHRRILVIGESKAREGISDIIDTFSRDPSNRLRNYIIVAKGSTAEKLLKSKTTLEKVSGHELKRLEDQEIITRTTMLEFMNRAITHGAVPVAGAIQMNPSGQQKYWLSGTAVFKGGKLAGYLNERETRGFLWTQGKIKMAYITADALPRSGHITLKVTHTFHRTYHTVQGGQLRFIVDVSGKGVLVENTSSLDLSKSADLDVATQNMNAAVRSYVTQCVRKAQHTMRADVFGFGEEVYRNDTALWKQVGSEWDVRYPEAPVDVRVHLEILRPGSTGSPIQWTD